MTQNDGGMKISWTPQGDQSSKVQNLAPAQPADETSLLPSPSWMIGAGNMGQAVLAGWRAAGVDLAALTIIRPSGSPVEGVRTVKSLADGGPAPKLIILGVKPQSLEDVETQLRGYTAGTVIVSMLAGVTAATLRKRFPDARSIVRVIPNLPVAVRRGVTGLYSEDVDAPMQEQIGELFARLGYAIWAVDEAKLAAVGALGGAGPAYVARFIRALAKAGEAQGLSSGTAATIALETVFGTAWLAASTGQTMDALASQVASPNGTTEAGLAVLDTDDVLDELVAVTIAAAARRGTELAQEAEARSLA
jgi:pyrroline-5-carboxylate reductase